MLDFYENICNLLEKGLYKEILFSSTEFIANHKHYLPAHIIAVKAAYALNDNELAEQILSNMPITFLNKEKQNELINHLKSFAMYKDQNNYDKVIDLARDLNIEKNEKYDEIIYDSQENENELEEIDDYPLTEQMAKILAAQGLTESAEEILSRLKRIKEER